MATQYVLVFRRPVQLDGLTYPAGSIVPKGALPEGKLRSLLDGHWIEERREDELEAVPSPHRVPSIDPRVLAAAREHAETKRREYEAAQRYLESVELMAAEEYEPVETEPERSGLILDDLARPEPKAEPEGEPDGPKSKRTRKAKTDDAPAAEAGSGATDAETDDAPDPEEGNDGEAPPALPDHLS